MVRDKKVHASVISDIAGLSEGLGFSIIGLTFSQVKGPEGNIEYLLHISKDESKTDEEFDIKALVEESHNELNKS